jgi:hypothetical protein
MKARIYRTGFGDDQSMCIWDDSGKRTKENATFVFSGFSNKLHPYYVKKWNWIKLILACRAILLHHTIVPTVDKMTTDGDDQITVDNIKLPSTDTDIKKKNLQSPDGNIYVVVMDEEMGRGWGVFVVIRPDGSKEILHEDHRDNLLDWFVEGEFIKSMGIDYESKVLPDLNQIPENVSEA